MTQPKIGAGLEIVDEGALNEEQRAKLRAFKEVTKLENEKYLRDHPEIDCLISLFLKEVFIKRPENLLEFSAGFFMRPSLRAEVQGLLAKKYPTNIRFFEKFKASHTEAEMAEFFKDPYFWSHMESIAVQPPRSLYSTSGETIDVGLEFLWEEGFGGEDAEEECLEERDFQSDIPDILSFRCSESDTDSN